jgi:hypothetical protein
VGGAAQGDGGGVPQASGGTPGRCQCGGGVILDFLLGPSPSLYMTAFSSKTRVQVLVRVRW